MHSACQILILKLLINFSFLLTSVSSMKLFLLEDFVSCKNTCAVFFSSIFKKRKRMRVLWTYIRFWEGRSMRIRSKRTTSSERFRCRNLDATRLPARAVIEAAASAAAIQKKKNLLSSAHGSSYCFVDQRFHGFLQLLNFFSRSRGNCTKL